MKGKLSKMWRSGISMLLVICMVVGMIPAVAFASEVSDVNGDGKINYVSLGASNTNGYGIDGYLPEDVYEDPLAASKADLNVYGYLRAPDAAYPAQIAELLDAELHQLAISSMRTEEVLYLLGEEYGYVEDAYMKWRFTGGQKWFEIAEDGGVSALRAAYQAHLTDADVITIDLGWNNFGVYAFNNIKTILSDGVYYHAPDFEATSNLITEEEYQEIRASVLESLNNNIESDSDSLGGKMGLMLDVLTYATLGAIGHFDSIVEWIYENNPNAKIVVINIQNLADDLVVEFEGTTLNLGDLYGELIDLVNLYRASESPYADKYAFADAGDVETFLDEIVAWDGDPTTLGENMVDCFDMYDDNLYVRSIVEYMMVGQALSGLFEGFRTMAAGYDLEVFKNDSQYTYEFALTVAENELLSLDLAALNLADPGKHTADSLLSNGRDKMGAKYETYNKVEVYGAAVAKHLKNLRGDAANVDAYDYVFEGLLTDLKTQKKNVEAQLSSLEERKKTLLVGVEGTSEENYPEEVKDGLAQLNAGITSAEAGIAQLTQAIEVIVPDAKDEFATKLKGVYDTYHNTLNYAYDVVATMVQYAAGLNTIEINADSLNGFNAAATSMMDTIANDFINGAMNKFYYELVKNGVQTTGYSEVSDYVLDENKFDPALRAILVLAVRYELGNSFFAHPNENGHDQITKAVLRALVNSDAGEFTDKKMELYMSVLEAMYPNLYAMLMGADNIGEVDDLTIIVQLLKMSNSNVLVGYELDALEAQIRAELRAFKAAHTEEEAAAAEAACYDLYRKLITLATVATGTNYMPTEDSYYVSLGDSTISGYGLDGYIDNMQNGVNQVVANSAHVLLAQSLYGNNWKNQFGNFCQGSLRADDLLLFLGGDVELDDYYYAEIEPNLMEGTLEATQAKFIENVERADLISVAIGGGNFLTFAGKYINRVVADDPNNPPYALDWERIGVDANDASMKELQEALDILVPVIDALGLLDQYLPEGMEMENPAKFSRALAEGLIYGYASYNYYYSQVLERIKEINPDAQLLVLGMFNPVDDWTMTTTVNGEEITVNIGGAVANLMEAANLQTLAFALQHENTSYIDVNAAETILEAENPGKKLGFSDYYSSSFKSNGKAVHASVAGHAYISNQMAAALSTESQVRVVLAELYDLVATYGPEAYKYAYDYAEENGYIDEAVAAIDGVIAELSAIEVPGTDAFKAEVAAEIEQIIETLEAAKALLTEADVLDQASLDALQALLNEAADAMVQLVDVLEQAGVDVNQVVIIPALKAAHAELVNEVIPAVIEALEEAVKAGTEYLIEKLGEAYDALVEATIKAVKKYAPEVADAVYDYLYNNPEEVINFFKTYGPTMVELMGEYGDEALMVVGYMLYTYGEDIAAYIVENHETILAAIVDWAEIHGENTIALIQVYAEALGLCDAVREQIAELEAELEKLETALNAKIDAIEKELEELNAQLETAVGEAKAEIEAKIAALEAELAALKAEVETKIAEVKAAIEELKAELEAAIESGLTKVENLKAALANLDEKVAELIEAAKNAALDQVNAAIKGMEDAMAQLDDTIHDLAGEVYEELKNLVGAAANELLNAVVEAVKKYAPELADEIYDYLYNNPEKVIAFFAEYGDEILALAEKYGDEVLMVVGYVLYTYGEDIAAYIIENHEQLLMFITEWISVHGENAAKLLQVYAETLGLCDLVRGEIAELEKALAELEAELEAQLNTLNNVLQAQLAALEAELARLKAELENAVEAQKPVIEAAIAEIEKQIEEIKAVIEEVKALIAEIEKQIKEIKALLPEMKEKLQDLVDSLFDLDAALQYLLEAGFDAAAPLVQKALNAVADAVEALVGVVSDAAAEELNKLIDEAKKALDEAYWDATHTDYTVDKDSYYVGLGDDLSAPESYVELLATELGIDFNNLAVNGLTMTDLLYILDEDFEADEYTLAKFELIYQQTGYTVEQMRAVYTSELAKADLVSVGVGSYGITDLIYAQAQGTLATILREQMGDYLNNPVIGGYIREILTGYGVNLEATTYTMDWYSYIGEDGVAELNEILANVRADLIEKDIPETYTYDFGVTVNEHIGLPLIQTGELEVTIPVADLITMMAETYMYAYVTHLYNAGEVFNSIHEITPEAELLVIGMFNPMDEVVLNFGDVSIALGDYYTYMVDVMNLRYLGYAFMVPKTTFVAIPDTVTTVEEYVMGYADLEQMLMALVLSNGTPAFETDVVPTVGGHEYIKEQILDALTITVVGLLGDADSNGVVNIRDAMLVAQYANNQISADALDLTVCDVDGNGVVNIRDAMLIAQYANMQISQFPIQ